MRQDTFVKDHARGVLHQRPGLITGAAMRGHWHLIARRGSYRKKSGTKVLGDLLWEDEISNIVVNAGLNYLLGVALVSTTQITEWYLGLTDSSPTIAAADTMASHSGWTEVSAYSESTRPAWSGGSVSGESVDNSASAAAFDCDVDSTSIGGAFLTSSDTISGTTGTLYAAGAFSAGNKTLDSGDDLSVTGTFSASAS